jgi:hypothetical protein
VDQKYCVKILWPTFYVVFRLAGDMGVALAGPVVLFRLSYSRQQITMGIPSHATSTLCSCLLLVLRSC